MPLPPAFAAALKALQDAVVREKEWTTGFGEQVDEVQEKAGRVKAVTHQALKDSDVVLVEADVASALTQRAVDLSDALHREIKERQGDIGYVLLGLVVCVASTMIKAIGKEAFKLAAMLAIGNWGIWGLIVVNDD